MLLCAMVQKFKEENPRWEDVQTVMADKDMNECCVFKGEMHLYLSTLLSLCK